jgi:hypothetical protein
MTTVLDGLRQKLRACAHTPDGSAKPVAILWTDPAKQFAPGIEMLKQSMPELVELGAYSQELRRGPAIWVRCVVERTVKIEGADPTLPPIIYMPGVGRQSLRAGEDCPHELRPLVELLFRGHALVHQGGQDLTLGALLKSEIHCHLNVAEDAATNRAMLNAVREVLATPVDSLRKGRLEADDFNKMVAGDPIRDLLRWIGNADSVKQLMTPAKWQAFVGVMRDDYKFDPAQDGPLTAAERLCQGDDRWSLAWRRFTEAPDAFPGLIDALAAVEPPGLFAGKDSQRYLRANDEAETQLDAALSDLQGVPHPEACAAVLALEETHGKRRDTVWARVGRTRFANALKPLAALAKGVAKPLGGQRPSDFVVAYDASGWQADLALLDVVALIDGPKDECIAEVATQLVFEWLDRGARAFQSAVSAHPLPTASDAAAITAEEGCCVLFVDGLRYDLGKLLTEQLEAAGCKVGFQHRWAALPTVTATAKPAVTPVSSEITGKSLDASFAPRFKKSDKTVDAPGLRSAISAVGGQVIGAGEFATPGAGVSGGWREDGQIDALGHKLSARLAREVRNEVRKVSETVQSLLGAGWRSVRVVTDHGWLLMPGGLPKVELSKHLAATKWARCALLHGTAPAGLVVVHWHWNQEHTVATPPGIACFGAKQEYAHGGVSVQECLIPELMVTAGSSMETAHVSFASVGWQKYRCVIETNGTSPSTRIDIRVGTPNGNSAVKGPRTLDADGSSSMPVQDDFEKKQLFVVLLDAAGTVIAQRKTKIGEIE